MAPASWYKFEVQKEGKIEKFTKRSTELCIFLDSPLLYKLPHFNSYILKTMFLEVLTGQFWGGPVLLPNLSSFYLPKRKECSQDRRGGVDNVRRSPKK